METIRQITSLLFPYLPAAVTGLVMMAFALMAVGGILWLKFGRKKKDDAKAPSLKDEVEAEGPPEPDLSRLGPDPDEAGREAAAEAPGAAVAGEDADGDAWEGRDRDYQDEGLAALRRYGAGREGAGYGESYLVRQFLDFYAEVIRLKRFVTERSRRSDVERELYGVTAGGEEPEGPPEEPRETADEYSDMDEEAGGAPPTAAVVHNKLLSILEQQALDAKRQGGDYGATYYREAQYVMASLADEVFLHMDWDGKRAWRPLLLEYKLFGTKLAGAVFFQKLDKLLLERDPVHKDLALLYLTALSLGFMGRYRGSRDLSKLDFYRRELFSFIYNREPDLGRANRRLFPEAYAYTFSQARPRRLPHLRVWVFVLLGVVVAMLVASQFVWVSLTDELRMILGDILGRGA